jgi:hypothetical protein
VKRKASLWLQRLEDLNLSERHTPSAPGTERERGVGSYRWRERDIIAWTTCSAAMRSEPSFLVSRRLCDQLRSLRRFHAILGFRTHGDKKHDVKLLKHAMKWMSAEVVCDDLGQLATRRGERRLSFDV